MSANVKSLITGAFMLVVGLILYFTTDAVHTPVFTLTKVGVVLVVLGVIELVITTTVMVFPPKKSQGR
ncbi:DUF5708 family protein [Frankia sp. AgB32]|uniref:DUF5708 family protein n=1 Tax=Frankia sp. AgB32 TaxID=631119 RepID=UPI00200D69AB|nr:DUF5708 family protein [Frankia sp. AgB32]MCK9894580.1 DUF5708 family protein [Frankia sp. AgB32]